MGEERLVILYRLPRDGVLTAFPRISVFIADPLPAVGERIRVRTCEDYRERWAVMVTVNPARHCYQARLMNECE